MAVSASDIVIYGSANMQESDSGSQGGAIDTSTRIVFTDLAANDTVDVSGSVAGAVQNVVITGRTTTGAITSETITLNGTTAAEGSTTFERILKITCQGHPGTVTVYDNSNTEVIATLESGVETIRRPFYNVSADPTTGGGDKFFYEKVFVKNNNGSSALLNVSIAEQADGIDSAGSGSVDFDLESSQNGSNTSTNRATTPSSAMLGTFSSDTKSVPGTDLSPASGIGIWLRLSLPQGTSAANSTYTLRVNGSTA
jgi:hypothetical protein